MPGLIFLSEMEKFSKELEVAKEVERLFKKKALEQFSQKTVPKEKKDELLHKIKVTADDFKNNEGVKNWITKKYYNDYSHEGDAEYFETMVKAGELFDLGNKKGSWLTYSVLKSEMKVLTLKSKIFLKYSIRFNQEKNLRLFLLKQELKFLANEEINEGTTDIHLADMRE